MEKAFISGTNIHVLLKENFVFRSYKQNLRWNLSIQAKCQMFYNNNNNITLFAT